MAMADDGYDFEKDVPDDHDLIRERQNPADRKSGRAYLWIREMLRQPDPELVGPKSQYPLTHPWWPEKGHKQNTDRFYDDHVAMFGPIPGYVPSRDRGYVPRDYSAKRKGKGE